MRSIRLPATKEEKVAMKIGTLISDLTLNLELVGKHLALSNHVVVYARALEVLEAAQYNKTVSEYRQQGEYYADKLF